MQGSPGGSGKPLHTTEPSLLSNVPISQSPPQAATSFTEKLLSDHCFGNRQNFAGAGWVVKF